VNPPEMSKRFAVPLIVIGAIAAFVLFLAPTKKHVPTGERVTYADGCYHIDNGTLNLVCGKVTK
jgi:hypothetical protein